MADYIDREKVMEEIHRIGGHNLCGWDTIGVKALIDRQPIADVVPRSEYDAVVSAVDNSTKEFLKLHDAYQNQKREFEAELNKAKQEVAREIFEEIENIFIDGCEVYHTMELKDFAELKKKYIGEETESE